MKGATLALLSLVAFVASGCGLCMGAGYGLATFLIGGAIGTAALFPGMYMFMRSAWREEPLRKRSYLPFVAYLSLLTALGIADWWRSEIGPLFAHCLFPAVAFAGTLTLCVGRKQAQNYTLFLREIDKAN